MLKASIAEYGCECAPEVPQANTSTIDPLLLIGGISAAGAIITAIATTVQSLYDIRRRYDEADLAIRLLIVELNTIKAALIQIQ